MRGQGLDRLQSLRDGKVICPVINCHLQLEGSFDRKRLARAVEQTRSYVPELFYSYDKRRGCFTENHSEKIRVLYPIENNLPRIAGRGWDPTTGPQLRIGYRQEGKMTSLVIGMTHFISDAKGVLTYISLLTALYNGETPPFKPGNTRSIASMVHKTRVGPSTCQEKQAVRQNKNSGLPGKNGGGLFCLNMELSSPQMEQLSHKAHEYGATMNEVFLAAYARVITRLHGMDTVLIPCPADLRRFGNFAHILTVANMTGLYRVAVEVRKEHRFTDTLQQLHLEMLTQKKRRRCFAGLSLLQRLGGRIPPALLKYPVRTGYPSVPFSYSNIGVIDGEGVHFRGCRTRKCFLTGAYRKAPDFQLTVSTYQNTATLNTVLCGNDVRRRNAARVLSLVRRELLDWIREAEK